MAERTDRAWSHHARSLRAKSLRAKGLGGRLRHAALALVAVLVPPPAVAATGAWVRSDMVEARLVSAVAATGSLQSLPIGLEIKLDDGWKTYWRAPGDAGLPPQLDWTGSANLAAATLLYPAPQRLTLLGLQTFGYKHAVVFPLDARVGVEGQPMALALKLDLLVCAELCVPKTIPLALRLPAGAATPDPEAQVIAKARAAVPGDAAVAGLAITSVEAVLDKDRPALEIRAHAVDGFDQPDVIAEIDPPVALGVPRASLSADRRDATLRVPLAQALPAGAALRGRAVTLTLTDGDRALETRATIAGGGRATPEAAAGSLLAMIAVALLGGLILNLMPCVLPVLSLKFIAFVGQGRAPMPVRAGMLASAAGIVTAFLAIAGLLLALKAAGRTIGWGLQFQQPAFIAGMAVVVSLFACHLWGLFEVPLPGFVASGAGRRVGPDTTLPGHFVTGMFATLLATPCSAPFLGTAVGFALASDSVGLLAIFLALGVGMAAPYLLVAAIPRLASRLPRPGRWMLRVKQVLGVALAATAAWLVWILAAQAGQAIAAVVAALLVGIALLLVLRTRLPAPRRPAVAAAIAALALASIGLPDRLGSRGHARALAADDTIAWHRFDRGAIKSLVSQGKTVFVDVTADWCLTCQANKRLVLSQDAIAGRLNTVSIPMQADWTRPDAAIAGYLAQYGRYGIPFNVVYGPRAPRGIVLPELLSSQDVTAALDKAGASTAN